MLRALTRYTIARSCSRILCRNYTATVISGSKIAAEIKSDIKQKLENMKDKIQHKPGLAVILVGNRKDSESYVRAKQLAAAQLGFESFVAKFDEDTPQETIIKQVKQFNDDEKVHGILVQLPLPEHVKEDAVLSEISIEKDVDGFNPQSMADIATNRKPQFTPCTPKGCMELLDRTGVDLTGKEVVVIGRSNIVGLPLSLMLLNRAATVTICHSYTENLDEKVKQADIVISACGSPELVRKDWIKPGAIVIDVGINSVPDETSPKGYRIVGDVCFDEVKGVASFITPVPGGVGPMTVAMLMKNTWKSFIRKIK